MGKIEYAGDMTAFLEHYYGDRPLVGAEIGVLNGDHALRMLQSPILKIEKLYLIDPYDSYVGYHDHNRNGLSDALETAIHKLAPYSERIKWLFLPSLEALKHIDPISLQFFYADGNHAKQYVHDDLYGYYTKLWNLGVGGGHDYYTRKDPDNLCEVQEVVDGFAENLGYPIHLDASCKNDWPDWWFIKDSDRVSSQREEFKPYD